jgi:biopolymer transport protein ExbB
VNDTTATVLGFGHFLAQSDAVGKFLLGVLLLMSIASWALIIGKGLAVIVRRAAATSS